MDTSPPDPNVSKNEAVAAWIRTFPADARLMEYLQSLPVGLRDEVERSARAILQAAAAYLDQEAEAGPINLAIFHPALAKHLKPRFPWMTAIGLDPLCSYTGWYAWHEGYLAAPPIALAANDLGWPAIQAGSKIPRDDGGEPLQQSAHRRHF